MTRRPAGIAVFWIALFGCSGMLGREPDLDRLYAAQRAATHTPVIVIPGVFGSRLRDPITGREEWPGGPIDLITGRRFGRLALSPSAGLGLPSNADALGDMRVGDRLVVDGLFLEAFGRDYYRRIISTLTGPGGYSCIPSDRLDEATADADCILLDWDWRRDFSESAARLEDVVRRLRRIRGDRNLRVDIVAHSAGGLVARYFLRFGGADVLRGEDPISAADPEASRSVRRVVLIGTPNYGSVSALQAMIMGNPIAMGAMPAELLATMPGAFQIMPNPNRTWMIDVWGQRLEMDLYDVETWRSNRWSIFDPEIRKRIAARSGSADDGHRILAERERAFGEALERGRRFHDALSFPIRESTAQYVVFGGDCALTPARCLVEEIDGRPVIRLRPGEIANRIDGIDYEALMLEPGDGRVTKASLLGRDRLVPESEPAGFFPVDYAVFICTGHADLPADMTFRDNLLNILLY